MVVLSVGDPAEIVGTFPTVDAARAFVQVRADALLLKVVERVCDDGRVQFIVKAYTTAGPEGFQALLRSTVYEARPCE
jgi:hypothetical protein